MIIEPRHFSFLQNFIKDSSGISLTEDKTYLLEARLEPVVRKFNITSTDELVLKLMQQENVALTVEVIEAITTNETYFFRDIKPFKYFEEKVLKPFIANAATQTLRIWCAACSTGQEPYSLAMMALENSFALKNKKVEIVASDINLAVLKKAEAGIYTQFEVQRGLPINMLLKYFDQLPEGFKIKDNVKNLVSFKMVNLIEQFDSAVFDVIFCRNVMIYFDTQTRADILNRLARKINKGGRLFFGTSETNMEIAGIVSQDVEMRSVYEKL